VSFVLSFAPLHFVLFWHFWFRLTCASSHCMHFQCQTCASYNAEQRADRESGKMLDLAHTHTHTPLSITISDRSFHTHKTVMIASLLLRCTLFSWHFWFCEALSASGFLLLTEASYTHVQNCSSACNTHYDLRCVASYQPSPSYFYPTGKTRASMPTGHWCEITQNTVPRLASSPRQNSHMQCQPRGRVYNVFSPITPGVWILLLSGTKKQNSVKLMARQIGCKHCKGVSQKQFGRKSAPHKGGHRPHHQPRLPPVLQIKKRGRHWPGKRPKR